MNVVRLIGCLRGVANKICRTVESKAGEHLQLSGMGRQNLGCIKYEHGYYSR